MEYYRARYRIGIRFGEEIGGETLRAASVEPTLTALNAACELEVESFNCNCPEINISNKSNFCY